MRNNSTLLHRLHLWFEDQPESAAQYYQDPDQKWQPISVRAYWLQVVRIALFLERKKLQKANHEEQSRVVIFAPNSPEWVHWELGAWLAGQISVGIHPSTQGSDFSKMVEITQPMLIVTDTRTHANLSQNELDVITFSEASKELMEWVKEEEKTLISLGRSMLEKVSADRPCTSVFTSGTTGTPKGVLLGLRQMTFVAETLSREWNLPFSNGVLFSFLPLAHVAEKIHSVAVALTMRYPVWFNSSFSRFLPELREVRPTMLLAVPQVWQRMKEQIEARKPKLVSYLSEMRWVGTLLDQAYMTQVRSAIGLDRLRLAVSGSVKLPPMVFDWFLRLGVEIQEIYGMSETAGLISLTHAPRSSPHAVGSIPPGIEVKISSEGEVWVRGPNIFHSYDRNPEETSAALYSEGWLKTGDLGEWIEDESGTPQLHLIGRIREIIKLQSGRMIAPVPIENEMKKIPEISNVCVMGEGLPGLVALVTLKETALLHYKFTPGVVEGVLIEDEALKKQVSQEVQKLYDEGKISEKIMKVFILSRDFELDHGEITPTQKLNRNRLRKNFEHFIDFKMND